jgi:ribosomal protein S18 acetylase RimI-like enzyme
MIREATTSDIDAILELTKACAKHMISKGIFQWNEHYPHRTAFENDLKRGELFVIEMDASIVGCIVISTLMDDEYIPIDWMTVNDNNVYIHRLAVHPSQQGKGFARQLMDFAEAESKRKNSTSIRLDTFSQNKSNQNFYELRGYKRLETIFFPKQSEHPFYCYEYIL